MLSSWQAGSTRGPFSLTLPFACTLCIPSERDILQKYSRVYVYVYIHDERLVFVFVYLCKWVYTVQCINVIRLKYAFRAFSFSLSPTRPLSFSLDIFISHCKKKSIVHLQPISSNGNNILTLPFTVAAALVLGFWGCSFAIVLCCNCCCFCCCCCFFRFLFSTAG